jgi:hypothetical protein
MEGRVAVTTETTTLPTSAGRTRHEGCGPFFRDWRWKGVIGVGGMGHGSPDMSGDSREISRLIQDGLWCEYDFEQRVRRICIGESDHHDGAPLLAS